MSSGSSREFPVTSAIEREFDRGLAAGLDAATAERGGQDAAQGSVRTVTTTLRSRWLHRLCAVCGHTFRRGDIVRTAPEQATVHDMPGLRCASESGDTLHVPEISVEGNAEFFTGLSAAWPMSEDVEVVRLEGDHPLLAPPRDAIRRRSCRVCGHTFRPMDHVVYCPCSLVDPSKHRCAVAVHRDLLRQMHCWDQWVQGIEDKKEYTCLGFS